MDNKNYPFSQLYTKNPDEELSIGGAISFGIRRPNSDKGLPHFGFKTLDDIAPLAFIPGSLVVFGGLPGSGKTSFLMNVLQNIAIRRHRVCMISLEMG